MYTLGLISLKCADLVICNHLLLKVFFLFETKQTMRKRNHVGTGLYASPFKCHYLYFICVIRIKKHDASLYTYCNCLIKIQSVLPFRHGKTILFLSFLFCIF